MNRVRFSVDIVGGCLVAILLVIMSTAPAPLFASDEAFLGDLNAYTVKKGPSFSTLEDWIADNYTDYLDLDTVRPFDVGDFQGIAFRTSGEGTTESYLIVDNGEGLLLLTTTTLTVTNPDLTEDQAFAKQQRLGLPLEVKAADACDTSANRCNCVFYARCRVPKLPYGMTTYSEKVSKINSTTPSIGSVAIMNIYPPYGHVAVVTAVNRDSSGRVSSITVSEANYQACRVSTRTATPVSMKVTGYYRP